MDHLTMWTLIVGFLLPNVIAVVQRPTFTKQARTAVTALFCAVAGVGTAYFTGEFNFDDVVGSVLIVGVSTITFYKGFWKPAGVAPTIENKTSSGSDSEGGIFTVRSAAVVALVIALCLVLGTLIW